MINGGTEVDRDSLSMMKQQGNQDLNNNVEECRVAEEKFLKLKSEDESFLLNNTEMENLINTLEDKIRSLSEASRLSEIQM